MLDRLTARFDDLYSPVALAADRQPPAGTRAFFALFPAAVPRRLPRALRAGGPRLGRRRDAAGLRRLDRRHARRDPGRRALVGARADARSDARRRDAAPRRLRARRAGRQPRHRAEPGGPRPLAEPLARHPPVLELLPERLRRPHRQQGDPGRRGDRDRGQPRHRRGLVRRHLRAGRGRGARRHGPGAAGPDRDLAGALRGALRLVDAADRRGVRGGLRGQVGDDRPHGGQLHQHPDPEDLRRRRRGGRLCRRLGHRTTSAPSAG